MFNNRILSPDDGIDDEDLQFLEAEDRDAILGLEKPAPVTQLPYSEPGPQVMKAINPPAREPLRGDLQWRLAEIARARGVVNREGSHAGKVALSGLARGTGLAHTTIKRILAHPEQVDMVARETLIRLCGFLRCQPGDLLIFVPHRSSSNERENAPNPGRNGS